MRYLLIKNIIFNGSVKRRKTFFCVLILLEYEENPQKGRHLFEYRLYDDDTSVFSSQHFHFFRGAFSSAYF